jgi:catechol 2,3-dioxygenase-like lactoylglutathione lyase family enzyme
MNWKTITVGGAAFIAGIALGTSVHPSAAACDWCQGMRLNHVGISVSNLQESLEFYTKKMGFREAFAVPNAEGQPRAIYVQVSRDTFVELLEATPARPPGFVHVGFEVDDMNAAAARLKAANIKVASPRAGRTRATVAEVDVPDGVNVELLQFGPESMQRKAIESWTR